jgi:RNA polymerase sigma-70 factor (ECF subfamily)
MTRSTLIRGACDPGNGECWREFDKLYRPLIRVYVRDRGVAEDDVEDAVQAVFLKLIRGLRSFQPGRCRFRTWLYAVTRNAVLDLPRGEPPMSDLPDPPEPPSEDRWRRDYQRRVLDVVLSRVRSEAKPRDWRAFEQSLLLKRRAAVIAGELGITVDNLYKITSRVFAKVRDLCFEYDEDLGDDAIDVPG